MQVISRTTLLDATKQNRYRAISKDLDAWYQIARTSKWKDLLEVQRSFPKAEAVRVGDDVYTVFNVRHNEFRLVVKIVYVSQTIFVKYVMAHAEYDRDAWKRALKKEQQERKNRRDSK
jgi:mRNA interferase HigB